MKFIRKNWITIIFSAILVIGISLLLYPTVSDYWNSFHQSRAIASYAEAVSKVDKTDYKKMLEEARKYNKSLLSNNDRWNPTKKQEKEYDSILDVTGTGIMAYIDIPSIKVSLPIYHGTNEGILQIAIGHIEGSSLPVGGKSTHCVISGHRGLPSAKLFTDLDKLTEGDTFEIRVLNETLTYEVDQILIVKPDDVTALGIEEDKDQVTLVTCTPYGINSHRLLVRGHRIATKDKTSIRVTAEAQQVDTRIVAAVVAVIIFVLMFIFNQIKRLVKKRKEKKLLQADKKGSEPEKTEKQ